MNRRDAGRELSRAAQWQRVRLRRLVAALLAGAAVVVGLAAVRPAPEPTASVVVAAHDVEAGERLTADDLRLQDWPRDIAPRKQPGREDLIGRRALGPVHAGEAVTTARLVSSRSLRAPRGADLIVSLPLIDPGLADILRARDRVDVFDTDGGMVARSAQVLSIRAVDSRTGEHAPSVLLAVARAEASAIARATSAGTGTNSVLLVARSARPSS